MDFGTLISVAQKNEVKKQAIPCYQTKFAPPKKQSKQSKTLSDNIKKFLARKEEEEKQKALEEKRKKENLLALRDHKTQSRINKHLKVCKAANKSAIEDAIDRDNTAITMAGPSQPDEDDYGYESQAASELYIQLMNKYKCSTSEKSIFNNNEKRTIKDIASTKDRVKQALKQQELEESNGHRRKRKSCTLNVKEVDIEEKTQNDNIDNIKEDVNEKPKQKKKPPPPPMDFAQLLKLAEKKQHEPVMIEVKPKIDEERPMTKRQKEEYIQEKERRTQREKKNIETNRKASITPNSTPSKSVKTQLNKVLKNDEKCQISNAASPKTATTATSKKTTDRSNDKPNTEKSVSNKSSSKCYLLEERKKLEAEKRKLEEMRRAIEEEKRKLAQSKTKQEDVKSHSLNKVIAKSKIVDKQISAKDTRSRQNPSSDTKLYLSLVNNKPKQVLQSNVTSMKFGKVKKPLVSNKRRICDDNDDDDDDDDEDDEESDVNDFIDDGPEEHEEDYSKHISEIFGYDKNKYHYNDDEDDTIMESNYAQQMREEYRSAKIGIMEDLEDMRMEALQKKKKAFLKQKIRK